MDLSPSRIEQLINAPERQKVVEIFGCQFGIWGVFLIIAAYIFSLIFSVFEKTPSAFLGCLISGTSAALGVGFIYYEIYRRRNRTVLVRDADYIAVCRKGRFELTIEPNKISIVKPDIKTMVTIGTALIVCAAICILVGIDSILRHKTVDADTLILLSVGFAFVSSFVSASWTRFACAHLRVPFKSSKWLEEDVLVPKSRFNELFP